MLRISLPSALIALLMVSLLSRGPYAARGQEAQPASLELSWGDDGMLTVTGTGFGTYEGVMLTMSIQSQNISVTTGIGTIIQSSQSSSQSSSMTLTADDQGTFRLESGIRAPEGAEIVVTASGNQGSYAEVRTTVSQMR